MDDKIILCTVYTPVLGQPLMALYHKDDPQCQMSGTEGMAVGLVAALCFGGKY